MEKICYFNLVTYSKVGGIENFNKSFLRALDELQHKITSVSVYDQTNDEQFTNVKFENFHKNKIQASLYILKNIYKIDKLIVAHINLLPIVIVAKILNPKLQIYLCIYGIEVWKNFSYLYKLFFNKIKIISISSYTTNIFTHYNKINKQNINYLAPCINIDKNNDFDNVYNKNEFNILSVTRLDKNNSYKGVDSMIKTIPLIIKTIPNLKYTIVGKGNDKERLEYLVKDLNIDRYVDFKDFVEFVEPYYQYCDIFALPSEREGFGIVYIEAMKYKKPCIACIEGGQTDVVIDGYNGYLCEYDDTDCIVEKNVNLYQNIEERIEFGKNGYKHLMKNFTFKNFKERLEGILK